MVAIDTHQHLWSEPLWDALASRRHAPFVDRTDDRWLLHLPAEPACAMPGPEAAEGRAALLDGDGIDLAVIAPSTALGLEWLPRDEAAPLLAAHRAGVEAAGRRFRRWAVISLVDPDPAELRAELESGAVGLCIGAGALAGSRELDRLGPVLEELARADAPLFVHPGPAPSEFAAWESARWSPEPWWWAGLTDYVSAMQRSWLLWISRGRREHPSLRVMFAMLAGLAPLQASRLAARGARALSQRAVTDPLTFFETSSYDAAVQQAVAAIVGPQQLVHGSDRPVVAGALPAIPVDQSTTHAHALLGKAA
ncbi:MAG: amidohydrolase family protein [Patulibacter minatonensis]